MNALDSKPQNVTEGETNMTTAETAKSTHDHLVFDTFDTFDNLETLTGYIDEGLDILDNILSAAGSAEPAGSAYMVRRIKEHTKALSEALDAGHKAFRSAGQATPVGSEPTSSTSTTASSTTKTDLSDFEGPLRELEGLAQTMLHAAQTTSVVEVSSLNFLACRCHDLWGELQATWESASEARQEREAAHA